MFRKDILGWLGACHGQTHLHFEIFMTQKDFEAYFAPTPLGHPRPTTPIGPDCWGHGYYVIPGGSTFARMPPDDDADAEHFPPLQGGQLDAAHTLYVETYFHRGQRYTRSWLDPGHGKPIPLHRRRPVADPVKDYEYTLYERATTYAPTCPSDGYERLRFGRLLSPPATLPADGSPTPPAFATGLAGHPRSGSSPHPHATWISVRFGEGLCGYLDISDASIQKLSDADFPSFTGWQKVSEDDGLYNSDGLCEIDVLKRLVKDTSDNPTPQEPAQGEAYRKEDALVRYVKRNDDVRQQLRGFICKAISEWDSSNNPRRYGKLREEGEFYHGREGDYDRFIRRLESFQFWDKTGLPAGEPLWFFHPLQFIRHFRRCGWLSEKELTQMLPMSAIRSVGQGQWVSEPVFINEDSQAVLQDARIEINQAMRKFGIAPSPWRMAAFLANAMQETQWFARLYEGNPNAKYAPWDGRGFLQLTWPDNYLKYWAFLGRTVPDSLKASLHEAANRANNEGSNAPLQDVQFPALSAEMIGWREDVGTKAIEAARSAGAYWAWTGAARFADQPPTWTRCVQYVAHDKHAHIYYRSDGFGQVAATVNFGSPAKEWSSINKVNGIVARFQAYSCAMAVLADDGGFPDASKQPQAMPDGFKRRDV